MSGNIKSKEKKLIKNTGILAVGSFCSKILSFFLLPLYTNVLTTEDFGTIDVLQTIASFLIPFISLEINTAVFRFIIEKKEVKEQGIIISTAIFFEIINIIALMLILASINFFFPIKHFFLFLVYTVLLTFLEMFQNILRGFGNNKLYSIMSFVMTTVSLCSNIVLILVIGMKGESILIASSFAYFCYIFLSSIKLKIWKYIKKSYFSVSELKKMLMYSLPLIPNAISWWITNLSDRLIIPFFLGAASNGIYAAANKIPNIYTTIFNVYNIAWAETLSRGVDDSNHEAFINKAFNKSLMFFGCICIGIICCMSIFFHKLIGSSYSESYNHIYILMIAIFINSLCSLYGGVFTAYKKSKVIGLSTVVGAVVNITVNLLLIRHIKLYAASISTLVSYLTILLLRRYYSKKLIKLKVELLTFVKLIFLLFVTTVGYFIRIISLNFIILVLLIIFSYIFNKELVNDVILGFFNKIKKLFKINKLEEK